MRRFLLVCVAGCASAGPPDQLGGRTDGGNIVRPDSSGPQIDAFVSHIDAPPGQATKTLDENTNDTFKTGESVACPSTDGFGDTAANNYYRVFTLSTFGITTDFHVTQVSFQVEDSEGFSGGGTTVAVSVGSYTGTVGTSLTVGALQQLASNSNVDVPEVDEGNTSGATVNVPLDATIPAGGKVFIEVDSSDGSFDHSFYMGANTAGESASSYMLAPDCSVNTPTAVPQFYTAHAVDLLMTVTGTY